MTLTIRKTRNKFEKKIERQLKTAKVTFSYETEKIPYVLVGKYIPDFILDTPNGRIYVECKGYFRPEHKRKMAAVKKQHPTLDIRLLFYAHNTKYVKWAEKNGFIWAVGSIPEGWLKCSGL